MAKRIFIGLLFLFFLLPALAASQAEPKPLTEQPAISVQGRLTLEKHGTEERLVLHGKDAQAYLIRGELTEKLKNLLTELGERNLVSLSAKQGAGSSVSCKNSYKYEYDKNGEKELKTETRCIRYYYLEVSRIISAKKSDEEMPPVQRDSEEEKRSSRTLRPQPLIPPIVGEIYGRVTAVNLKSAIKSVEIANQDKNSPLKNITLIINPRETRIAKKIGREEPVGLRPEELKTGQKVTAVYSRDEFKAEALFITVTKE